MAVTVATLIDTAQHAYAALASVAEAVDDEWQYLTDLTAAWNARLEAVARSRGIETAPPEVVSAVEAVVAHVARITDPHRAFDWLSTMPQVVLLTLDEGP